jgi:hypothetical protein
MTVKDAIQAARGLSDIARIRVAHSDGTQDDYNYDMILKGEIGDPVLNPGDKVYVTYTDF